MKNTDRNQEFGLFGESDSSFICVYPVDLWFYFSKLLYKQTTLSVSPRVLILP